MACSALNPPHQAITEPAGIRFRLLIILLIS
jgi:hypothetical protein